MEKLKPKAPNGQLILGTLGLIQARANVDFLEDGSIQWGGETKIFWETQETVIETRERDGQPDTEFGRQRIWLDEDGGGWPENQINWGDYDPTTI